MFVALNLYMWNKLLYSNYTQEQKREKERSDKDKKRMFNFVFN